MLDEHEQQTGSGAHKSKHHGSHACLVLSREQKKDAISNTNRQTKTHEIVIRDQARYNAVLGRTR
jgi:hypothetical protein